MSTIKELRRDLGITQEDLAVNSGVTRDYIVKLEEVIYAEPSFFVVNYLSNQSGVKASEIFTQYRTDYVSKHSNFEVLIKNNPVPFNYQAAVDLLDSNYSGKHPHVLFRELLFAHFGLPTSQVKYSKFTGVHPSTVSKYELTKVRLMPRGCRTALEDTLNVPAEVVEFINNLGSSRFDARQ